MLPNNGQVRGLEERKYSLQPIALMYADYSIVYSCGHYYFAINFTIFSHTYITYCVLC